MVCLGPQHRIVGENAEPIRQALRFPIVYAGQRSHRSDPAAGAFKLDNWFQPHLNAL
jgi:hypothetical protein